MISEEEAFSLLSNVENENLRKHMVAVGAIMAKMAEQFNEDKKMWMMTGLLHDADYGKADMEQHGLMSAEMLEGKLPEEALHAIKAHNERTGVKAESMLDKVLIASDAASGLIVATALVMPEKKLSQVKISSLVTKFKDKSFARRVERKRITICEELGLSLEEFLSLALEGMMDIGQKLGL